MARPAGLAGVDWGINHVLSYGQSLSNGWEGNPALSRFARLDTLMFGQSVRPLAEHATRWEPVGEAAFRPLRATVQAHSGGPVLDAQTAATATDPLLGETVLEGALNFWRARMRDDWGGYVDPRQQLLASACGVGGQPIEALSRGAQPEFFNRLRDCVRQARLLAEADQRRYGITAIVFLQGEHNNFAADGATSDTRAYGARMRRLYDDILSDVVRGVAGQDAPPALFTYQTGGSYATETNTIPQAQLETALSTPGMFLVAPVYPVTDKGGHLDANGYRWMGAQFGKVMHRVISRGEDFRPLHPTGAERDGLVLTLSFHVPYKPLAWARPYAGHVASDIRDRGFVVLDAEGEVPIADVALEGDDRVRIALARAPRGKPRVRYASAVRQGRGCLCDSDPTVADDTYRYAPNEGHRPTADIPEMIDRPYPLMNWCVAFSLDVE